jgi:hypothetical protein
MQQAAFFHNCETYNFYPNLKKEITINQFKVKVVELELFKYVRIVVALLDTDGNFVEQKFFNLVDEDYTQWSSDDTYVINFVKRKLREQRESDLSLKVVSAFLQKKGDNDA